MVIFDETGVVIEHPNLELGCIDERVREVTHSYIVDTAEQGHMETVAEFPKTGGKLQEWRVDVAEVGHWETCGDDGEIIEHYDGIIPDDWPKEQIVTTTWNYGVYIPYTDEELAEIEQSKNEVAEAAAKAAEREKFVDEAPTRLKAVEDTQSDADAAICALYEMILGGGA